MSKLSNKVVIVTGASSGIGEATAVALGQRGANVVATARREERLEDLVKRIVDAGGHAVAVAGDIADRSTIERVVETAMTDFKRVDVLINNAGIMPLAPLAKCRVDEWDAMIDVNIKGLLYGIAAVLPIMIEQKAGHVVNVSSVAGRRVFPNGAVYCGTKHAVHAISEGLRGELAEQSQQDGNRIRVTTIAPGVVTTELQQGIHDDQTRAAMMAYINSIRQPLTSEDIAASILYAVESPEHVDVNEVLLRPVGQLR